MSHSEELRLLQEEYAQKSATLLSLKAELLQKEDVKHELIQELSDKRSGGGPAGGQSEYSEIIAQKLDKELSAVPSKVEVSRIKLRKVLWEYLERDVLPACGLIVDASRDDRRIKSVQVMMGAHKCMIAVTPGLTFRDLLLDAAVFWDISTKVLNRLSLRDSEDTIFPMSGNVQATLLMYIPTHRSVHLKTKPDVTMADVQACHVTNALLAYSKTQHSAAEHEEEREATQHSNSSEHAGISVTDIQQQLNGGKLDLKYLRPPKVNEHRTLMADDALRSHNARSVITKARMKDCCCWIPYCALLLLSLFFSNLYGSDSTLAIENTLVGHRSTWNHTLLLQFEDIDSVTSFWLWASGPMVDTIYNSCETSLNGTEFCFNSISNRVIGSVRVRQQRVQVETCRRDQEFVTSNCFPPYSVEKRETRQICDVANATYCEFADNPYTSVSDMVADPDGWKVAHDLNPLSDGRLIAWYDGSGYMAQAAGPEELSALIAELDAARWVSLDTRVVYVEFTTFNPGTGVPVVVKLVVQFSPTGAVIPLVLTRSLPRQDAGAEHEYLSEALFLLSFLYAVTIVALPACLAVARHERYVHGGRGSTYLNMSVWNSVRRLPYTSSWWWLEVFILLLNIPIVTLDAIQQTTVSRVDLCGVDMFLDLINMASLHATTRILVGVLAAFAIVRCAIGWALLKPGERIFLAMYFMMAKVLRFLLGIFVPVFIGVSMFANLVLGPTSQNFSTLLGSMISNTLLLRGAGNILEELTVSTNLVVLYCVMFLFVLVFVLYQFFYVLALDGYVKANKYPTTTTITSITDLGSMFFKLLFK